jgi:AcrR family transcriptional regulator
MLPNKVHSVAGPMSKTNARKSSKPFKRERRPEERPQELLEAALSVFSQRGFRNTRLDDVADAAGVTKGAIYHYFDTKEELLLSVIDHYQSLAFGRVEEVLAKHETSASERIEQVVKNLFRPAEQRNRRLLALLIRGIAHEVPRVHNRWLRDGPVRLWTLVASLVDEGKRAGEFRADADSEVAARILISGLILQRLWNEDAGHSGDIAIDHDRLIDSSIALFFASLRRARA